MAEEKEAFEEISHDQMAEFGEHLAHLAKDPSVISNTRLQNLICAGIPIYNVFAAIQGWPSIPLPAFCSAPSTPTAQ